MKTTTRILAAALLAAAAGSTTHGAVTTFSDRTSFLATTGASDESGPLPDLGTVGRGPVTVGSVVLYAPLPEQRLAFGDWTTRLPGADLFFSGGFSSGGVQDLDVVLGGPGGPGPVRMAYAFGFDFVEPRLDPNFGAAYIDSTFTVTLFSGDTSVGSFTFNAPDDIAASRVP